MGEYVLSGHGEIRKVLVTHERQYNGRLATIQMSQFNEPVSLTEDHMIYVVGGARLYTGRYKYLSKRLNAYQKYPGQKRNKKIWRYFPIQKVRAGSLKKGMTLLYPLDRTVTDIKVLDLSPYITKKWPPHGKKPLVPPLQVKIDENLLRLLGYYIAEGSNHRAYIRFSLGNHEETFAKEILKLIDDIFGIKAKVHRRIRGEKTGLEITACNSILANVFENLCGKGADRKHIPFVLQQLPKEKRLVVLTAIFKGDGYEIKGKKTWTLRKAITTISKVLSEQLIDILLVNGFFPSASIQNPRYDKLGVHHKKAISISWSTDPKASRFHHFYETKEGQLFWLLPIQKIRTIDFSGKVYNLTVDKDHSYSTSSFAVANCGSAGDVFTFLEKHDGMTFVEALEFLAEKTGVKLDRRVVDDRLQQAEKQIFEINHLAAEFYHYILTKHRVGQKARDYLKSRRIAQSAIETFNIGYSPNQWDNLFKFLIKKGYQAELIEQAGLAIRRTRSTGQTSAVFQPANLPAFQPDHFYDRFRGRAMFPLRDVRGQVLGFAGRLIDEEVYPERNREAKYINSPETPVYHKAKNLFGIFENREDIRKKNEAVLVEGEFDCLSSWQAGVRNAVAVKGTALTVDQVKLIRRYARKVVVCLDADSAGQEALIRSLPILEHHGLSSRAITLPAGEKDPDEMAKSSPAKWKELVEKSENAYGVIIENTLKKFREDTVEAKRQAGDVLVPLLSGINNAIEQDHWINILAKRLGVRDESIRRQMSVWKQTSVSPAAFKPPENEDSLSRGEILSRYLLGLAIQFRLPMPENFNLGWVEPVGRRKLMGLLGEFIKQVKGDFRNFRQSLPPELVELFDEAALAILKGEDPEIAKSELELTLRDLEAELVRNQLKDGKLPAVAMSRLAARLKQLVRKD